MKIYTITCHNVYNYGASLQAYALQQYLLKQGHEAKIIDYRPDYLDWHYRLSWWIPQSSKYYPVLSKSFIRHGLYVLVRYLNDMKSYQRALAFRRFNKQYFQLTSKCKTIKDVKRAAADADCLITGSDQVWNSCTLQNGIDTVFYLGFAPKGATKISYAASFGGNSIDKEAFSFVKDCLSNLNSISVRETSGINVLHGMGLQGAVVCDPVFLLNKDEWFSAFKNQESNEGDYIFIYNLGHDTEKLLFDANLLKQQSGLKTVSLLTNVSIETDKELRSTSPERFVSLISNARVVLTNSFHATSFSILFNKKVYVYTGHEGKTNARIDDLVKLCGIGKRLNPDAVSLDDEIDYENVNKRMREYIESSKSWLSKALFRYEQ